MYYYNVFGLNFASELEMPMFHLIGQPSSIDVHIKFGVVPMALENPIDSRVLYEAKPNQFLLRFIIYPLRYLVENGNSITIDTGGHNDLDFIRLFLITANFGALLHQRNVVPLHAGGFLLDGQAVLFAGDSGAGKSTTTAAFREKGYTLVADDVGVVSLNERNVPMVEPGVPFIKLWKESLDLLDKEAVKKNRIREDIEKYYVPITDIIQEAVPIKRIYFLEKSATLTEPIIKDLSAIETVHHLRIGTYRYYYLIGLGGEKQHFKISFSLGQRNLVKHLTRPEQYPVDKLVAFIEKDLKEG
jgi:hypothetical protein